jgi:bifunctional pyridoxal-dependent enzyme with beta-cystathionase and maltose regulon repressor activities
MEDKEEEIKEQFYEELQRTQDRVLKHNVIIIMGDIHAKLGKEKVFSQVIGRHTLHNISNENGEMVAHYAHKVKTLHTGCMPCARCVRVYFAVL